MRKFQIGRKPDFILKAKNKFTGELNNKVGVAWCNENESITLRLEPFIDLKYNESMLLTLFPNKKKFDDDE